MQLAGGMIFVKDFPRMRDFYRALLQAEPVNREWADVYAKFAQGQSTLALHAIPSEIAAGIAISDPPKPREQAAVKLIFAVSDIDEARARLESLGGAVVQRPWGDWDGVDPEGNVFGLSAVL
jgi:predicted enzyme related to lactoylglutathione lyase